MRISECGIGSCNELTYLPQLDASVRVLNCRHTAVRVDGLEWLLLKIAEVHDLGLVRNIELLKNDGDLPWVWALGSLSML